MAILVASPPCVQGASICVHPAIGGGRTQAPREQAGPQAAREDMNYSLQLLRVKVREPRFRQTPLYSPKEIL